jgi:hypothetical protein
MGGGQIGYDNLCALTGFGIEANCSFLDTISAVQTRPGLFSAVLPRPVAVGFRNDEHTVKQV